jgi:hypothetical protein
VVIEPSLEIVTCHRAHSIIGQSLLVHPQNEVAGRGRRSSSERLSSRHPCASRSELDAGGPN